MLKKPSAKFFRTWLPIIIVLCGVDFWVESSSFKSTMVFFYSCPSAFRAIAWHRHHGDTVTYDNHVFHLPAYWYPDPESYPNKLILQEAHFGSLGFSDVLIRATPQKLDDRGAQQQIADMAAQFNQHSHSSDEWTLETLEGRSLSYHCMMSSINGVAENLICHPADSDLYIFVTTAGRRARADALNILETSE